MLETYGLNEIAKYYRTNDTLEMILLLKWIILRNHFIIVIIDVDDMDVWNFMDILQKLKKYDEINLFYRKVVKKFPNDSNLKTINKFG